MAVEEQKNQLADKIREVQIKYIYYVIALNVAAVAFSLNNVKEQQFNCSHFILGGAIFFWGLGVIFGFRYLSKFKQVLHIHFNVFNSIPINVENEFQSALYSLGEKTVNAKSSKIQTKAERTYKFTLYFFI